MSGYSSEPETSSRTIIGPRDTRRGELPLKSRQTSRNRRCNSSRLPSTRSLALKTLRRVVSCVLQAVEGDSLEED
uniref:Uncharacterized protein n=1 Tax=Vespula pensylvanica TaxID=30213 RepID=A0A834JTB3_VESPE|nr:hypothetical protein H0235_017048 [Vespula pensylvanica]